MNRRQLISGSVAAAIAATVATPAEATAPTQYFEPFELKFWVGEFSPMSHWGERYGISPGLGVHTGTLITLPFDEAGMGVLDLSLRSEEFRNQVIDAIKTRVPDKMIPLFHEDDDILWVQLHKRLSMPYAQSQGWMV